MTYLLSENLNSVKGLSVTVVVVLCSHLLCEGILPHSLSICFQIEAVLTWWVSWGTRAALLCAFPIGAAPLGTGIARKLLRKRQIIGIFKGAMLYPISLMGWRAGVSGSCAAGRRAAAVLSYLLESTGAPLVIFSLAV